MKYSQFVVAALICSSLMAKNLVKADETNMMLIEGDIYVTEEQLVKTYGEKSAHEIKKKSKNSLRGKGDDRDDELPNAVVGNSNQHWKRYRNQYQQGVHMRWIIPFTIGGGYTSDQVNIINQALTDLANAIGWITFEDAGNHPGKNRIFFNSATSSCSSPIGYQGRDNNIELSPSGCVSRGIVQHEVLHTLGFWHEQSRPDRDNYIEILWQNIEDSQTGNFLARSAQELDSEVTPYDFGSVMHYSKYAFTKNNLETINAFGSYIGQRNGVSTWDIYEARAVYYPELRDDFNGDIGREVLRWYAGFGWNPSSFDHSHWTAHYVNVGRDQWISDFVKNAVRRMFSEAGKNPDENEVNHWYYHYYNAGHKQWMRDFIRNHLRPSDQYSVRDLVIRFYGSFGITRGESDIVHWTNHYANVGPQTWRRDAIYDAIMIMFSSRGRSPGADEVNHWINHYHNVGPTQWTTDFDRNFPPTPQPTPATPQPTIPTPRPTTPTPPPGVSTNSPTQFPTKYPTKYPTSVQVSSSISVDLGFGNRKLGWCIDGPGLLSSLSNGKRLVITTDKHFDSFTTCGLLLVEGSKLRLTDKLGKTTEINGKFYMNVKNGAWEAGSSTNAATFTLQTNLVISCKKGSTVYTLSNTGCANPAKIAPYNQTPPAGSCSVVYIG